MASMQMGRRLVLMLEAISWFGRGLYGSTWAGSGLPVLVHRPLTRLVIRPAVHQAAEETPRSPTPGRHGNAWRRSGFDMDDARLTLRPADAIVEHNRVVPPAAGVQPTTIPISGSPACARSCAGCRTPRNRSPTARRCRRR